MAPKTNCPNCGQSEWLENPVLNYLPQVRKLDDESYALDTENGVHVKLWRCNNCLLVMQFWEPD